MINMVENLEKRMKEVEHGFEVVHESQKSLVNHITGDVGKKLNWFTKNWPKIKKRLDTNHDGIIQIKELANPWFLKIVLVNFLAIITQIILITILRGLTTGSWGWDSVMVGLSAVIGPFIVGMLTKYIVDDYDHRLKIKENMIIKLKEQLANEKMDRKSDINKHEIEMTQLSGSLELKNQEINWLNKYGKVPNNEH